MLNQLLEVFSTLLVGIPVGYLVLRYFFKGSILLRITVYWVATIFVTDVLAELNSQWPDTFPSFITIPVGMIITISLFYIVSQKVRKPLQQSIDAIFELSEGNLQLNFGEDKENSKNELGVLNKAVLQLKGNFGKVVGRINESTINLSAAGDNLNNVAQSLASGSAEQSASLEEVSSSMEEMYTNITLNAENAEDTKNITLETKESVYSVNKAASVSIEAINEIVEKINVINEIAFQTNILALNASVEAARAGEAGKGFAVVATEVRKLAERTKMAAEEINNLSTKTIESTHISGKSLNGLLPEIERTSQLVENISTASKEQSAGAEQINITIQQLNSISEQNAATSEELSSSSEVLIDESNELKDIISYFKL